MSEATANGHGSATTVDGANGGSFEVMPEIAPPGLVRRYFTTQRHFWGLLLGAYVARVRHQRVLGRRGARFLLQRLLAAVLRLFVKRTLVNLPFPVQLRRRLEMLGPTYIKLGQILALRSDLLPAEVTDELKNLLDRLPVVPFERFMKIVVVDVGRPAEEMFSWVDPMPLGSASIAQTHRATTIVGEDVILKVVKPGIRETLQRDSRLLNMLGWMLQLVIARIQPKQVIREFTDYTLSEVDLRREADNAETFAANFRDLPDVHFPKIYREYSSLNVLCMEFLDGVKPSDPRALALSEEERNNLIDLGAAAIIRMLFHDGFFHADLHPANLMVLPGPRLGFIDLGMVGRLDEELRRTLLYYYYCLVMGDTENAARYLTMIAQPGSGADPHGFQREVEEIVRRWRRQASFRGFSLAQLILESVGRAAQFRMYFPVEMVLMVKALLTFEGVGHLLVPDFDVAAVSQRHVQKIFFNQFNPLRLVKEGLRGAPEIVDALIKAPLLVTEGLRVLERSTRRPPENPFAGIRGTLFAGFCLVAGAILAAFHLPVWAWAPLFVLAVILALRKGS
ncbi:MAG: AarF/ABC1/UbiB kinase family protein [Acidobacteria bacterium]|nr:AarF/ABC1/UbiB kinase family protein [Acidobacteriota bacterium]